MIATIIFSLVLLLAATGSIAVYYYLAYTETAKDLNETRAMQLQAELEKGVMKTRINNLIHELEQKNKLSEAIKNRRRGSNIDVDAINRRRDRVKGIKRYE